MELLINEIDKLINLNVNKVFADVFSEKTLQNEIINKVRYEQLFKQGVSEENVVIGYYSPYTESINPNKKAGSHYTLLYTGDFFETFRIDVGETFFIINASGDKPDGTDIVYKFGEAARSNILGLTEANMDWLIETITPKLSERIEAIL